MPVWSRVVNVGGHESNERSCLFDRRGQPSAKVRHIQRYDRSLVLSVGGQVGLVFVKAAEQRVAAAILREHAVALEHLPVGADRELTHL